MAPLDLDPSSIIISAGRPPHEPGNPLNAPITLASALIPGGTAEYARAGNPVWEPLEEIIGALEGGHALAFSSGVATSAAVFALVPDGAAVVIPRHAYYGSTHQVTSRHLDVRQVDVADTEATIAAIEGSALVWLESPTNPALEVADLPALIAAAHEAGALVAVDNTFSTPLRQTPLAIGADIVTHSASKLISGHSDVILGIAVTAEPTLYDRLRAHRHDHGAIAGALESWLAARGVRTLHVRLERAEANARTLASRAAALPGIAEVRYPGHGTIVALVAEDAEFAQQVTEASQLIVHATSLGGVESTWERRRRHASEPTTIPAGLIRLSVGIEHVDDLWNDLEAAWLSAIQASSFD